MQSICSLLNFTGILHRYGTYVLKSPVYFWRDWRNSLSSLLKNFLPNSARKVKDLIRKILAIKKNKTVNRGRNPSSSSIENYGFVLRPINIYHLKREHVHLTLKIITTYERTASWAKLFAISI